MQALVLFPYKLCMKNNTCSFPPSISNYHETWMAEQYNVVSYFMRKTLAKRRGEKNTIIISIIVIIIIIITNKIITIIIIIIIKIFLIIITVMIIPIMMTIISIIIINCIIIMIMIINNVIIIIIIIIVMNIFVIIYCISTLYRFDIYWKMRGIRSLLIWIADFSLGIHSTCRSYGSDNKWRCLGIFGVFNSGTYNSIWMFSCPCIYTYCVII